MNEFECVLEWNNLCIAWERVADNRGAPGPDTISISRFARHWEENLRRLADLVRSGRYQPGKLRRVAIPKRADGQRLLSIPNIGDRVLQRAVLNILERRCDRQFLSCSYGYRPGRGLRDAVAAILELRDRGQRWVLDADIDDCFDSLDHALLSAYLKEEVKDGRLLALIASWMDAGKRYSHPLRGIAQGMPISPLLCNLYLHRLDEHLVRGRWNLIRYADDFVICCANRVEAERAQEVVSSLLAQLQLRLNPNKTRITSFEEGFEYLGVYFERNGYRFTWEDKEFVVEGPTPTWLWSFVPAGYQ